MRDYDGISALITVGNDTVESTFLHPFWVVHGEDLENRPIRGEMARPPEGCTTAGRWVFAGDICVGDELLSRDGRILPVQEIQHRRYCDKVYNFHVADLRCYAVGQSSVLVHNENFDSPSSGDQAPGEVPQEAPDNKIIDYATKSEQDLKNALNQNDQGRIDAARKQVDSLKEAQTERFQQQHRFNNDPDFDDDEPLIPGINCD